MLTALSIRDYAIVRTLDLEFSSGFTALTGETGAGKSVLLSALGFVLGRKGQAARIRPGASSAQATAVFDLPADHPARAWLSEQGVEAGGGEPVVIRRLARVGQASRSWINDQPVSAGLIEAAGALIVDLHDQHESVGLSSPARQRSLLDACAGAGALLKRTGLAAERRRLAVESRMELERRRERASADRDYLEHVLGELSSLAPEPGEASRLALSRASLQAVQRHEEAVAGVIHTLEKNPVDSTLASAARQLARALASASRDAGQDPSAATDSGPLSEACEALNRAQSEFAEAMALLQAARRESTSCAAELEAAEARLFALRGAARKHGVEADGLADALAGLRAQLDAIDRADDALAAAAAEERAAEADYLAAAADLSALRAKAASRLTRAVAAELKPLRLGGGKFRIRLERCETPRFSPGGEDDIAFEFASSPSAPFAMLGKTASGGEMARLSLALGLCLAHLSPVGTLVFDEADVGVGGAVAAAIGERLARLGAVRQVLAVTHSPQVAAAASRQLRIARTETDGEAQASVEELKLSQRREEIARMLSGTKVTQEARAAADRLLAGA